MQKSADNLIQLLDVYKRQAYEYAAKMYERMKVLLQEEAIAQSTFDQAEAQYIAAKETYDMALEGARTEDKAAANALVAQADGAAVSYTHLERVIGHIGTETRYKLLREAAVGNIAHWGNP